MRYTRESDSRRSVARGTKKSDWECQNSQIEGTGIANSPFGKLLEDQVESCRFKVEGTNEELCYPVLHEFCE